MENLGQLPVPPDEPEVPEPQPLGYVTFDAAGNLTGSYFQLLHPDHEDCHIRVDEPQRLQWVNYRANEARDGLELLPPPLPGGQVTIVPQTVTRRQARQALLLEGLLDDVPVAIAAIPDETERRMAQIEWEDSQEFVRSRPLVIQIGAALGLDSEGLDRMFITAASL